MNMQRRMKAEIKETSSMANIVPDNDAAEDQRRISERQVV
jgi:hypothetical protein